MDDSQNDLVFCSQISINFIYLLENRRPFNVSMAISSLLDLLFLCLLFNIVLYYFYLHAMWLRKIVVLLTASITSFGNTCDKQYFQSYNPNRLGWVGILVRPKTRPCRKPNERPALKRDPSPISWVYVNIFVSTVLPVYNSKLHFIFFNFYKCNCSRVRQMKYIQ